MAVKILSDSACDLPDEIIEEFNIDILPILVSKGEKEYLDKVTLDPKKMYDDMRKGEVYKTAQIPPYMFDEKFEEIARKNESISSRNRFYFTPEVLFYLHLLNDGFDNEVCIAEDLVVCTIGYKSPDLFRLFGEHYPLLDEAAIEDVHKFSRPLQVFFVYVGYDYLVALPGEDLRYSRAHGTGSGNANFLCVIDSHCYHPSHCYISY
jgi:hypothetical protein